jgi:undecaprenyl-diphosphatase
MGATLFELSKAFDQGATISEFFIFLPGMLVAGVVGYFAIALIKKLVAAGRFGIFAYYCAAMGVISICLGIFT